MMYMQHELATFANQALQVCPGLSVRRLARRLTQSFDRHLSKTGLTLSQFAVLSAILLLEEEATAAEIARQLDADRSTLSRELSLLESRGLIETREIKGRRRALKLSLEGEALYREAWKNWQSGANEVDAIYGVERVSQIQRLLQELLTATHIIDADTAEVTPS
jgi:DNA-binding MarR family transcriptional regulator